VIKRCKLSAHLEFSCPAYVIKCNSFHIRKLQPPNKINNNEHTLLDTSNINKIILDRDREKFRLYLRQNPVQSLIIYRHYLDFEFDEEFHKIESLKNLIKIVYSEIFPDISIKMCVYYPDFIRCSFCKNKLLSLERERFRKVKYEQAYIFGDFVRNSNSYEDFLNSEINKDERFLQLYTRIYPQNHKIDQQSISHESMDTYESIISDLIERLVVKVDQDYLLNVNLPSELTESHPCKTVQLDLELNRQRDRTCSIYCDCLLKRNEFNEHYNLVHNFLMPYLDIYLNVKCPYHGCKYYAKNLVEFNLNSSNKNSDLTYVESFDLFHFRNLQNDDGDLDMKSEGEETSFFCLLDLPLEVIYEIVARLNSLSLYYLSLTNKVSFCFSDRIL
jgi:hypothetical protein